jgi:hypothetical protein
VNRYWIDKDLIRFETVEKSGFFHIDYEGLEMLQYLAWLEEGNTPEPWGDPDAAE